MAGRRPKPTHLKLVTGNPGKRPPPKNEPQPDLAIPNVPHWLSDAGKVEWGRIVHELDKLGLMTNLDAMALAAYCQAVADWQDAEEHIRKFGKVIKSPIRTTTRTVKGVTTTEQSGGYPIQSPMVALRNRALDQMHRFLTEFGMTPAARTRVSADHAKKPSADDKAGKYFKA
jgi:P27 family predicted phage terminase small subunit